MHLRRSTLDLYLDPSRSLDNVVIHKLYSYFDVAVGNSNNWAKLVNQCPSYDCTLGNLS